VGFWRHLRVIGLLPGVVTLIVPATIIYFTGSVNIGWGLESPLSWVPSLLGCVLVSLGLFLMYQTISLFATVGEGTLAPWDPPRNLVVQGVYRYVRNPMISGVLFILLGGSNPIGFSTPAALVLGFLRRKRDLHSSDRGEAPSEALRGRIPCLQAERSALGSRL
jgi:protein-S-isoprenylcysteine O-methyltransferase Ste14